MVHPSVASSFVRHWTIVNQPERVSGKDIGCFHFPEPGARGPRHAQVSTAPAVSWGRGRGCSTRPRRRHHAPIRDEKLAFLYSGGCGPTWDATKLLMHCPGVLSKAAFVWTRPPKGRIAVLVRAQAPRQLRSSTSRGHCPTPGLPGQYSQSLLCDSMTEAEKSTYSSILRPWTPTGGPGTIRVDSTWANYSDGLFCAIILVLI